MKSSSPLSGLRTPGVLMEQVRTETPGMDRGELIVRAAFARIDLVALATAVGCIGALGLWATTAILLVRGAPAGTEVGPHLILLSNFMPGYSVSWPGSLVGVLYGFLIGMVLGALIAAIWNLIHHIYLVGMVSRRNFASDL